jgi:lysophospholipase L1-like esterase
MNTNQNVKRILCYGDSLTFGHDVEKNTRFKASERWTGILQKALGDKYEIIEEGLGGRTTDIDDPKKEGRNGLSYFKSAVMSHIPLDLIIILLGTNDLKSRFNRTPLQVANSFKKYKVAIDEACDKWKVGFPRVVLVSPPIVNESKIPKDWHMEGAEEKSKQLAREYEKIAKELGFECLDISPVVKVSEVDGTHLEKSANDEIANLIAKKISLPV